MPENPESIGAHPGDSFSAQLAAVLPVVAHAIAVFGDEHKATHWLSTPLAILSNRAPVALLQTPQGIQQVELILTRIEHNIPS
jgi:putative toxin-antitoxin system antitoxin component (TIGR02293 family)